MLHEFLGSKLVDYRTEKDKRFFWPEEERLAENGISSGFEK